MNSRCRGTLGTMEHLERYFALRGAEAVALSLDEAHALGRERVVEDAEGNVRCHC